MDFYKLFEWALDNGYGDLKQVSEEGFEDYYIHDKLALTFSKYKSSELKIYVLDGNEDDLVNDFKDSTLLVYSGKWVEKGSWLDYIEDFFQGVEDKIASIKEEKRKEEEKKEKEAQEAREEKIKRFNQLFDDTIAPKIQLKGKSKMTLEFGESYEEQGATAEDNVDGDLTDNIKTSGEVNENKSGEYTITYTVSDEAGNEAKRNRTVVVKEEEKDESDDEESSDSDKSDSEGK